MSKPRVEAVSALRREGEERRLFYGLQRSDKKETLDMTEYIEAMKGIYTTSVNEQTLDEAPMAYKSLEDIIDVIKDSVNIIDIMKPVYNFKASDDDVPWKKNKTAEA